MIDRDAKRESDGQATSGFRGFCLRVDQACARMNGGLAALAAVLAVVVFITAAIRVPALIADGMPADTVAPHADR
jgi:hypothetical protein